MKKNIFFSFLMKCLLFFFILSSSIFNVYWNSELREKIFNDNKEVINYLFSSKWEYERHFNENFKVWVDDNVWLSYTRKLKELEIEKRTNEKKEQLLKEWKTEDGEPIEEKSNKWNIFNNIQWNWEDSSFMLESLFWTSDHKELQRAWFLPSRDSIFYDYVVWLYWLLFSFFVMIWWFVIIAFIFFIIRDWKWIFTRNRDQWKFWKFEEYIISFIVIIVIMFWWIRLYMKILHSWVEDFKTDLNSIWLDIDVNSDEINWWLKEILK